MPRKAKTKEPDAQAKAFAEIRKKLINQKQELLSGAGLTRNTLPDDSTFPELGDQASAEINRNFTLRLRDRERKLLKKIESAIDKIETGTYGICESCGLPIGVKRLEARPVTTLCIECKTDQEAEERLREH